MTHPQCAVFVAPECAQLIKAGGLGDVVGALPVALRAIGVDARIVLPRYDAIDLHGFVRRADPLGVPLGKGNAWAGVWEGLLPGSDVPVYLLDHEQLFCRGYLYDPPGALAWDNLVRFAFLSRGALQLCKQLALVPDVFHVHDWATALLPRLSEHIGSERPARTIGERSHDSQPGSPGQVPRERPRSHTHSCERVSPGFARGLRGRELSQGRPLSRDEDRDGVAPLAGRFVPEREGRGSMA